MILVTSSFKPFSYTAKNTPRRQTIIKEYEEEINAIYAAVDESAQTDDVVPPSTWDFLSTLEFIRVVVGRVVKASLEDADDMFQKGCDRCVFTELRTIKEWLC